MSRLERDDAYLRDFEATLLAERAEAGARWWRLDRSAFYATGGGQPHDEGTLRGADARWRVVDVESDADDALWHRVEGEAPSPPPGAPLTGEIDWPRRWRHMQRHTAQHLLSQAFVRTSEAYGTRSVALSSADVTLDLAGDPDEAAVMAAVRLANEVAASALPIDAFEVDERDLGAYPLRRPPKVSGRVRLVRMGDWELSACGGTHLRSSAEALPILLLGRERIRGGLVRVTFRAGLEAIEQAHETWAVATRAARALTSGVPELAQRVEALIDEASALRRELAQTRQALARSRAALLGAAPGAVLAVALSADEAALATDLADAVAAAGASAVVAAPQDGKAFVVVASGAGVDVRPALQAALAPLGGRGGGKPARAQGSGPELGRLPEALEAARARLMDDAGAAGASTPG